jgi:hypothetical protein
MAPLTRAHGIVNTAGMHAKALDLPGSFTVKIDLIKKRGPLGAPMRLVIRC